MVPLFSKVDSNKLQQDEENVICAQFGKDLFNISTVIGRNKVAQLFWLTVYNWRETELALLVQFVTCFLADHTNHRAYATVLHPSVCLSSYVSDIMYCG